MRYVVAEVEPAKTIFKNLSCLMWTDSVSALLGFH